MNKKQNKSFVIVCALLLIVFSVLFLAIPFEKNAASWIAYVFVLLALILGCAVFLYALNKGDDVKSKVYGIPMLRLSYYYTYTQIIVSIVIIVLSAIYSLPTLVSTIAGLLLLVVFVIGVVSIDNTVDYIREQELNDKVKINRMKTIAVTVNSLIGRSLDQSVNREITKLAESIRFSDPVSNHQLEEIENLLEEKVIELKDGLDGDTDTTKKLIREIQNLLDERNRKCKESKG